MQFQGADHMTMRSLTGSRIRDRRVVVGLRQADLAKQAGISAAYLNLIEHNRRRIGGKLLSDIAAVLSVEPSALAGGAEAGLLAGLRDAADRVPASTAETAATEDFAGRFPGWADLILTQARHIRSLERTVETLGDRMAHDPHLATSLHELLSTVTAITSTASILVETDKIEDEWRDRFHRNIHEDSQRLAESSQALVAYLDMTKDTERGATSPQEELEIWLKEQSYHLADLERALPVTPDAILRDSGLSKSARLLAQAYLARYLADAVQMPLMRFRGEAEAAGYNPAVLAQEFSTDIAAVLRRIASLPTPQGEAGIGLVICDGSGTLTLRKPVDGFPLPRLSAACPLWPLYQALNRPMSPVRAVVEMQGRDAERFLTYAIAQPVGPTRFDRVSMFEATMVMLPADRVPLPGGDIAQIGTSCRICPQHACTARREPSILVQTV
jgi:hypothetical protein